MKSQILALPFAFLLAATAAASPPAAERQAPGSLPPEPSSDPPPAQLTEGEFLAPLSAGRHPAAVALDGAVGQARARALGVGLLDNPELSFEQEEAEAIERSWLLSWAPPIVGRRGPRRRQAEAVVSVAEARRTANLLALRAEARAAFHRWALAGERHRLHAEHAGAVDRLARRLAAAAAEGEVAGLAARRLALEAQAARAAAERGLAELIAARGAARGWRPDLLAGTSPQLPGLPPSPPDGAATDPIGAHPELAALAARVAEAELAAELAGRIAEPPTLGVGWKTVELPGAGSGTEEGLVAGIGWRLPLFDRRQEEKAAAAARRDAAEARLQAAEERIGEELAARLDAFRQLRRAATAAADGDDDRLVTAAEEAFRLGESSTTDLLDTLRSVLAARLAQLDLTEAALAAHRDLELAAGASLPLAPAATSSAAIDPSPPTPHDSDLLSTGARR